MTQKSKNKMWKPKDDERYWFIDIQNSIFSPPKFVIDYDYYGGENSPASSFFRTRSLAQQALNEILKVLKKARKE